jgi:hypothetical protein
MRERERVGQINAALARALDAATGVLLDGLPGSVIDGLVLVCEIDGGGTRVVFDSSEPVDVARWLRGAADRIDGTVKADVIAEDVP